MNQANSCRQLMIELLQDPDFREWVEFTQIAGGCGEAVQLAKNGALMRTIANAMKRHSVKKPDETRG